MTFLAPTMLWFGLLAGVPLVVHLYHQRKRIVARFSTNRFFTRAVIQSQRRMQLQRILLMLLRIGICLALALALARPFFLSGSLGRSAGKRDVVILLDDSMSMRTVEQGTGPGSSTATHFDRAKAATVALLQGLSKRDRAVVFTYGGKAFGRSGAGGIGLIRKPARLVSDIETLEPVQGAGNAFAAMENAARALGSPTQRARMMLMVTDFQAGQWPQSTWPQPETPVPVTVARVAEPARNNVWIDYARLGEPVMLPGQPNALEVCVKNGAPDARQVELSVEVNGRQVERRLFNIQGRGARVEQVPLVVGGDGESEVGAADMLRKRDPNYRVEAVVRSPEDPLADDNRFFVVTRSIDSLPVLLVEGQAAREMRRRSAYYLATALQSVSEEASIQLHQAPVAEAPWADLQAYRAVILSGIRSLRQDQVDYLKSFVAKGGGLIIFMCEGADPQFYNEVLAKPDNDSLLPGRITGLIVKQAETEPMHLCEAEWEHEVLRRFKGDLRSGLAGISIRKMYRMEPSRALTLIRVDRRMPLLVEKRYGQGTVLVFTTAPEPEWSDFPLRRNFIVLLNRMTIYAAVGAKQTAAYEVGRDMVVERAPGDEAAEQLIVRPDGAEVRAEKTGTGAEGMLTVSGDDVTVPGFYRAVTGADDDVGAVYAVNCPRSESVPRTVDPDELKRTAGDWSINLVEMENVAAADIVKGGEAVNNLLAGGKTARGMWDSLLWLALLALIVEPVIANRLSGGPLEDSGRQGEGGAAK